MKNQALASGKRRKSSHYTESMRHAGVGSSAFKEKKKNVSMTPDTFERSQSRVMKKAMRKRRSFNDETQILGNDTQLSLGDSSMEIDVEEMPETLSQISAINPPDNDTLTQTFIGDGRRLPHIGADETWEMAVVSARGEPDGAERSFTRKQLSKMSLHQSEESENESEEEIESEEEETPSPSKKVKVSEKEAGKAKKTKLKIPFKQAAKKLKSLKNPTETSKAKKQVNKNFEALPDETTVPKTPNQTWKEKKQQRKMMKNNFDLITAAKKSWEELRRSDLPDIKRKKICDELMKMVVGKIKELGVVHDSARVIQCLVQYGSEAQRQVVFAEVKDSVCDFCKSKYAKFIIRKLIHYGNKDLRAQILKCFYGQVRKMIRHKEASEILEYAFNEYATAPQRLAIMEEFYGPTFSLFKDRAHQSLDEIISDQPDKKDMVLRSMREALMPLVDKDLLGHSMVHKVFFDFFTYADDKSKKDMIENLREQTPHMLHTRDGTRVAMHCVWAGSAKDRKALVKSLKTHVVKISKEEHGHMLLLSIFDCVDDTVLVQKVILDELLKSLGEVVKDQHGKKVLLYLLSPRDPIHFHPDIVRILHEGDGNPTSKKDSAIRAKELCAHTSPHLIKYVQDNVSDMMMNPNQALVVNAAIRHATGDVAPAMRAIADFVAGPPSEDSENINVVEHPACHIVLKKLIANDKVRLEAGSGILFSAILLEALPKSTVKSWAACNRGCFILVSLLEVKCSTITEKVKSHLKTVRKSLSKMNFKGAEVLLEKLQED